MGNRLDKSSPIANSPFPGFIMTEWLEREIDTARDLIQRGSHALRQGHAQAAQDAFQEADAVLDMAEEETDEVLELRAQGLNELGVLYQRRDDLQGARKFHERSLQVCDELLDRDVDFRSNAAATHLNISSVIAAGGDLLEARKHTDKAIDLIESVRADGDSSVNSLGVGAHQNLALLYARN